MQFWENKLYSILLSFGLALISFGKKIIRVFYFTLVTVFYSLASTLTCINGNKQQIMFCGTMLNSTICGLK